MSGEQEDPVYCRHCGAKMSVSIDSGLLECDCLAADKIANGNWERTKPPYKGEQVTYKGMPYGTVVRTDGRLCYVDTGDENIDPFIWCFNSGLNELHDWPGKGGPRSTHAS